MQGGDRLRTKVLLATGTESLFIFPLRETQVSLARNSIFFLSTESATTPDDDDQVKRVKQCISLLTRFTPSFKWKETPNFRIIIKHRPTRDRPWAVSTVPDLTLDRRKNHWIETIFSA